MKERSTDTNESPKDNLSNHENRYPDLRNFSARNFNKSNERPPDRTQRATGGESRQFDSITRGNSYIETKVLDKERHITFQTKSTEKSSLNFNLVKETFREASANLGERCTEWLGQDAQIPQHDTWIENVVESVNTAMDEIGAIKDFASNFTKMQVNNFAKSDKYYHCMANCEASSRGVAGQNAARALSCFREASDVIVNTLLKGKPLDYTLKDSPNDMSANRLGLEKGRAGVRCSSACHSYERNWPEPKYR